MTLYEKYINKEVELLSLLFRDGEPSDVAREMHNITHAALTQQYLELKKAKDAAASDRDGKGNLKKRVKKETQISLYAIETLRDCDDWDDMVIEFPMVLSERDIKLDDRTLKRILTKHRRFIENCAKS